LEGVFIDMTKQETIEAIIAKEWKMFHNVNGEDRVDCQDERPTFEMMRNAQFECWDEATRESYLADLKDAVASGISLVKEKYVWMMEHTDKEGFEKFKEILPEVSAEKKETVDKIWSHLLAQTEKMREKYPLLALGGRPLHAEEEKDWPSIETYQKGELLTFSDKTVKLLLAHIENLEKQGIDIAYKIQENSVTCLGYKTMEEAEFAMANQFMQEMGIEIAPAECQACKANMDAAGYSAEDME